MNAALHALSERVDNDCFVFATLTDEHVRWLTGVLAAAGVVKSVSLDPEALAQRIGALNPSLAFVDFSCGRFAAATAAASAVRRVSPGLPIIAVGSLREPECALAALRAGVREFIDLGEVAADAVRITRQVLDNAVEPASRHGKLTVLLGARVGMGVSTLAANLSVLLQRRNAVYGHQVLLCDLGLPAGDGALLLNVRSEFSFVEAVRNVRRFDQTFVHTALSLHPSGLAFTTLPTDLAEVHEVTHAASVDLLNQLRAFFDRQIVDLCGFTNGEFIANVVQAADEAWLVCDQSVPSVLSAVGMLDRLREHETDMRKVRLVISKYESELALSASQIAQRLGLEPIATLPQRRVALVQSMNQGNLLAHIAPRDPYIQALDVLVTRLAGDHSRVAKHANAMPAVSKRVSGLHDKWAMGVLRSLISTFNER
ncbi:AAA family ATPase [Paraburkholderia sediminicola]|uniref:AAA family ATPase n=1 Tax=Paraburkholderia sediminicola TaxID=458836 RepID=UPI0038BDFA45